MGNSFLLYGHGGSYNHGAEAIVRTTIQMIRTKYSGAHIILSSHFPGQDREFGMDADEIIGLDAAVWEFEKKARDVPKRRELTRSMYADALSQIGKDTVCLSVGGDVFCYGNWHRLAVFQERAAAMGAKTILWGCSVEPSAITPDMLGVLRSYSTIVTRESITYEALTKQGLADKLVLAPDPAFALQPVKFSLPGDLMPERTVGINISPLITRREAYPGAVAENVRQLVRHIVTWTEYDILLIPHVFMSADNDFTLLSELWDTLSEGEKHRTYIVNGRRSAAEYKYAVSRCALLVCARTHVSIAAYSLGIPALVLGYSVKSRGIAGDLGLEEYVLDISEITEPSALTDAFMQFVGDLSHIREHLRQRLPGYTANMDRAYTAL